MQIKIIGCGNYLTGDDAVGIHVIEELKQKELSQNVSVIDAGTPGPMLLDIMQDAHKVIIVDAVVSGASIGTIHRFTDNCLPERNILPMSLHGFNIIDAIELGKKIIPQNMPGEIIIIGVEIPDIKECRVGLSNSIKTLIPQLVNNVLQEINEVNS